MTEAALPAPVPAPPRLIPGLGPQTAPAHKKSRTRHKKSRSNEAQASAAQDTTANVEGTNAGHKAALGKEAAVTGGGKGANLKLAPEALSVVDAQPDLPKRAPASVLVAKRIKAHQKKLQRFQGYKDQTEALNADQQKAVASIPVLEAKIDELQDLAKTLEAEEAEGEKVDAQRAQAEEKRVAGRIDLAVHEVKKHARSDVVLLCQFLHFYTLMAPSSGFAPRQLPPVVADATGQEAAAVRSLFEALANGPLLGDQDSAVERLDCLTRGDDVEVVTGVTYGRIKQMILDLTASPAEIGEEHSTVHLNGLHGDDELRPDQEEAAVQAHEALLHQPPAAPLNFIQASELDIPAEPTDVPTPNPSAREAPTYSSTEQAKAPLMPRQSWDAPEPEKPAQNPSIEWSVPAAPVREYTSITEISSWADDVEQASRDVAPEDVPVEAPIEPTSGAATPPPINAPAAAPAVAPAANQNGAGRNGSGRPPRGRGGYQGQQNGANHPGGNHANGENGESRPRGRGGFRGGRGGPRDRTASNGGPASREATTAEEGWSTIKSRDTGGDGQRGGRGRGGRGRGRGDGEYKPRGGPRGGRPPQAAVAPGN